MTLTDPAELLNDLSVTTYQDFLSRIPSRKRKVAPTSEEIQHAEPRLLHSAVPISVSRASVPDASQRKLRPIRSAIYRIGDYVDTDAVSSVIFSLIVRVRVMPTSLLQIIPASACLCNPSDETLGNHCLEFSDSNFRESVRNGLETVVAGKAFGCGSSREEAARALKGDPMPNKMMHIT